MPRIIKPKRPGYLPKKRKRRTSSQSEDQKFYNTTAWRNATKRYRNANPMCEVCDSVGVDEPARLTDHIVPIQAGGSNMDPRNWMGMCHYHHNRKRGYESRGKVVATRGSYGDYTPSDRHDVITMLSGPTGTGEPP